MLRKYFLFHIFTIGFLIFGVADVVSAQKIQTDKTALTKFEKSIEQGKYAEIERDLLNYVIANPTDAKGFELLAELRFAQDRLNEAKSLYQKTLSLDPNLTTAKISLAVVNFQTGNTGQALSALNEISGEEVSNDAVRLKLAQTFALVGDCQKALSAVEKLAVRTKNADALPLRALCYAQLGDKQAVGSLILPAKNLVKQTPAITLKFAEVLINAAMFQESADVLRSVVKLFPKNADALILLAKAEIYLNDTAPAKIHLDQAAKINPESPNLPYVKSLLESRRGNTAEALDLLEKSLKENPNSTELLRQIVIAAMRANQTGKAAKTAERLLELKPDEPEFLYLYGAASLQNNKLAAAESSLTKFLEMRPADSLGCLALGLTFAAQPAKTTEARQQLKHCVEIDPKNFEANFQLGLSYKTQGETEKAVEYFEAAIKDAPNYAPALRELGAVYLQSGAETKARTVLEKAFAIDPNDADTNFQLSRLYNLTGQTELAKKHLAIFQKLKNPKKDGM